MTRLLVFITILLLPALGWCQVDTLHIFYNAQWEKVSNEADAEYKRVAYKGDDDMWHVADYFKTGHKQMTGTFLDNEMERKHGAFEWFNKGGNLTKKGTYLKGVAVGEHFTYYENGQVNTQTMFDGNGKTLKENLFQKSGSPSILEKAEFPGGVKTMYRYISRNLNYPNRALAGNALLSFVVNTDGTISGIQKLEWSDPEFVNEAIRMLQEMPRWKPATRDKVPIKMRYHLPVYFSPKR